MRDNFAVVVRKLLTHEPILRLEVIDDGYGTLTVHRGRLAYWSQTNRQPNTGTVSRRTKRNIDRSVSRLNNLTWFEISLRANDLILRVHSGVSYRVTFVDDWCKYLFGPIEEKTI